MQRNVSYTNQGVYLDTNVDEGEYNYIDVADVDVIPQDSHQYEQLRRKQLEVTVAPADDHSRGQVPSTVETTRPGCRHPPCWGWAVLGFCFFIAAILVALLVFFLTNTTSSTGISSNTDLTASTGNLPVKTTAAVLSTMILATTNSGNPSDRTTAAPATLASTSTPIYRDCLAAYNDGKTKSGVYRISPDGVTEVDVYCEQEIDGGGWTVFQRRMDGSVLFNRTWASYKNGFGSVNGEYWLGNDVIHLLTVNQDQKLKVELQNDGLTAYADHSEFWIKDESGKYQLHVDGFTNAQNNPGNALYYHNGMYFSTHDRDNDKYSTNCAADFDSAWWYNRCSQSDLNAPYSGKYYYWLSWTDHGLNLDASRMMIKTK